MKVASDMTENILGIQKCRLYLRVATLAYVIEPDRCTIQIEVYQGICQQRKLTWPEQRKPTEADWKHWRDFL